MSSPTDFAVRALQELASGDQAVAIVTVPVPPAPAERVFDAARGPILRWDDPAKEGDGRAWSLAGAGEAARVEGAGDARFDEIRGRASELFAQVAERVHPEAAGAPPPRLYGGLAFRPEPSRAAPWSAFRDGSFALPRWLYGTSGDRAFLRIARGPGERIDEAEIRAVIDGIGRAAEGAVPSSRAPRSEGQALLERQSPEVWEAMIHDALDRIRAHELEKVVPMTLCRFFAGRALDARSALDRLGALYPECVRFAFQREEAVFLGASPERLVDKRGLSVASDALAGSAPRRGDDRDARAAATLLESDKDRREHQVVVDAIRATLAPISERLRVPAAPSVRTLRNVHHLWTPITATLARPLHVLELVRALHPTPAVCGTPRDAAFRWIAAHEPDTRGWYAGAVGWFDAAGDGAFSVAIRSGVLARSEAWLYAGAGIVEGSDASLEYAETRVKQAPMLAALGLSP